MPDHGKIGLRELQSCIHDLNEASFRLDNAITHFNRARKIRFNVEELRRVDTLLKDDVLQSLVRCIEQSIGKEEKN